MYHVHVLRSLVHHVYGLVMMHRSVDIPGFIMRVAQQSRYTEFLEKKRDFSISEVLLFFYHCEYCTNPIKHSASSKHSITML